MRGIRNLGILAPKRLKPSGIRNIGCAGPTASDKTRMMMRIVFFMASGLSVGCVLVEDLKVNDT